MFTARYCWIVPTGLKRIMGWDLRDEAIDRLKRAVARDRDC